MAIYYRGSGLTWEGYLQADSFVQDVTGQIKRSGEGVKTAISDSTRRMVASNEALERSFGAGFDRVNGTLEWGFDRVAGEIGALRSEFTYGMGLLHDQLLIANQALSGILNRLDEIHETLKHPLLTQARELSKRGFERLQRGLLPEALKDLHDSAEKNETDFVVQHHIGKLYLYGRNEMDSVIDLPKAERHLRLAARYAQSEMRGLPDAAKLCGEAYLHASIACYAQSNDRLLTDGAADETAPLREMLELARKSTEVYPQMPDAFYHHARYAALLGDGETCTQSLKRAILMERNYCLKVDADRDFDGARDKVEALKEILYNEAKGQATRVFEPVKKLLEDYVYQNPWQKNAEAGMRRLYGQAEPLYRKDTYFDYLDALSLLKQAQETFHQIPPVLLIILPGDGINVESIAFSPDGGTLVSGGYGMKLWSVREGREIVALTRPRHSSYVTSVAFSPDGGTLASGSNDHTVKLWSVREGREIATLTGHSSVVSSVAFSPDGGTLASGSHDNTVKLWSVREGREIATLTGHSYMVFSVAFSPDGGTLASGSNDHTVKLWSVGERREIATLTGHSNWVRSVAFSPDGGTLASGSGDNTVKLWSVREGRGIAALTGHRKSVNSVAFSPDGGTLASGSHDNTVKLWSVREGREIATLTGHSEWVNSVTFSPDGWMLASGSNDKTVKLWRKDVLTRHEFEEEEAERRRIEEERQQREAEEAERRRREDEAATLRAYRQQNKLCLECGAPLGFWDKLGGGAYCKRHRR